MMRQSQYERVIKEIAETTESLETTRKTIRVLVDRVDSIDTRLEHIQRQIDANLLSMIRVADGYEKIWKSREMFDKHTTAWCFVGTAIGLLFGLILSL